MANRSSLPLTALAHQAPRLERFLSRHLHFTLVLIAFLTFRLLMPFVFRSGSYFVEQAPDIGDYLRWGTLADSGLYPYVHYWSEYPPLFAWSMIGLYRLSTLLPAYQLDQRLWFALITQLTMTLFDLGSLILLYAIARQLGSRARATRTAALFAGAFITAYATSSWYEPVPLFFLLLSLYLALRGRFVSSALFTGIGIMTKLFPIVIVPMVMRRTARVGQLAIYLVTLTATTVAISLPFVMTRPDFVWAFVRSTLNRPTWLSVWALFDGNYLYGVAVPVIDRFTTSDLGAATTTHLPWWLIHLFFLGVFLFFFTRRVDWRDPVKSIAFAGLTTNLFLLWSKGFSGQFIVFVLPFVLLLMPNLRGILYSALLSVIWVAEWPIAFNVLEGQDWIIVWIVAARTMVLVALCIEFALFFAPHPSRVAPYALRIATYLSILVWISVAPIGVISVRAYTQARLDADTASPAIELIQGDSEMGSGIIAFAQPRLYRRLYTRARLVGNPTLLPVFKHTPEEARLWWLDEIAAQGPFWFVADEGDPETLEENRRAEGWLSNHACKIDTRIAGSARVSRFLTIGDAPVAVSVSAEFAGEIGLVAARLSRSQLRPGEALCVEVNWRAIAKPFENYTVFVHLIDSQGRLVAQNDQQPQAGFAPTSAWTSGLAVTDRHGLILPADLPLGEYDVRVGLYRSDDQSATPITRSDLPERSGKNVPLAKVKVVP